MSKGFVSKAQIRKFTELHKQGKVGIGLIASMALNMKTPKADLPEHIHDKDLTEDIGGHSRE